MAIFRKNERCSVCFEEHVTTSDIKKVSNSVDFDPSSKCRSTSRHLMTRYDPKSAFTEFCGRTSLHGWNHLSESSIQKAYTRKGGKYLWCFIITLSIGITSFFLFTSVDDFTSKHVVTNIDTTTASLHDVHFPSIIICNINQIRKSILLGLGINSDDDIDLLYRQFYTGMEAHLTSHEEKTIMTLATSDRMLKKLRSYMAMVRESNSTDIGEILHNFNTTKFLKKYWKYIISLDFIRDMVVENPGDTPILSARYGYLQMRENATDLLPFFGSDKGHCSIIKPQLMFNSKYDHLTYAQKLFGDGGMSYTREITAGAKVGKVNGLKLLLDAETFDYTMDRQVSEGFKISVNYHLDQPLMSMTELDISPGFETQVAITPVLYETSNEAQNRFTPIERGCYLDHELNLTYLPKKWYRYSINNCLFEAAYEKILQDCNCTPFFHSLAVTTFPRICNGYSLLCMNQILDQIGEYREVEIQDVTSGEKRVVTCLEACKDQQNQVAVTMSRLPNRQTMLKWPEFCIVVEKLKKSCDNVWKRIELDRNYPSLCNHLESEFEKIFSIPRDKNNKTSCMDILKNFNVLRSLEYSKKENVSNESHEELVTGLFKYARENLALVNIYIKPPVVTRIMKDERTPVIRFVANFGGILGLCMGCSIVTGFEVFYFIFNSLFNFVTFKYKSYKERRLIQR